MFPSTLMTRRGSGRTETKLIKANVSPRHYREFSGDAEVYFHHHFDTQSPFNYRQCFCKVFPAAGKQALGGLEAAQPRLWRRSSSCSPGQREPCKAAEFLAIQFEKLRYDLFWAGRSMTQAINIILRERSRVYSAAGTLSCAQFLPDLDNISLLSRTRKTMAVLLTGVREWTTSAVMCHVAWMTNQ